MIVTFGARNLIVVYSSLQLPVKVEYYKRADAYMPNKLNTIIGKQKQKYRGMFETQKSGNKTSSGEIGLNNRTFASPKVGQDQVS